MKVDLECIYRSLKTASTALAMWIDIDVLACFEEIGLSLSVSDCEFSFLDVGHVIVKANWDLKTEFPPPNLVPGIAVHLIYAKCQPVRIDPASLSTSAVVARAAMLTAEIIDLPRSKF